MNSRKFLISNRESEICIEYRRTTFISYFLLLFLLFITYILVHHYLFINTTKTVRPELAIGYFLHTIFLYAVVAHIINRIRIRISKANISVSEGPLPFSRRQFYRASDIRQLYTKKRIMNSHFPASDATYDLRIILKDRRDKALVLGFTEQEECSYVEDLIENFLGIEDRHIRGQEVKNRYRR